MIIRIFPSFFIYFFIMNGLFPSRLFLILKSQNNFTSFFQLILKKGFGTFKFIFKLVVDKAHLFILPLVASST